MAGGWRVCNHLPVRQVSLSQGWYLADGSAVTAGEEKLWTIPLFAVASGSPGAEPHTLMREATHTLTIKGDGAWVKLNAGQNVPLRVKCVGEV